MVGPNTKLIQAGWKFLIYKLGNRNKIFADESFVERLMLQYNQRGSEDLLRQGPVESNKKHFVLQHFQGTNPVLYNADGWLQSSREDAAARAAGNLLQASFPPN